MLTEFVEYQGSILSSNEKALALTREKAFVWSHVSPVSSPTTTVFNLPHPSRPRNPLPIGSLVKLTSDGDTGLLVISPATGKITYWDNIENANTLSLFEKRRHGLEGSLGSLLSGEIVVDLENAGQAGFVVVLSSGRTAQLLLQDAQSRSALVVNWLRNPQSNSTGGFFGSLRSVFTGGNWLADVVGARAWPSNSRGWMEVTIATGYFTFQFWQLGWSGQPIFGGQVDARGYIEETLIQMYPKAAELFSQGQSIKMLDFAILQEPENARRQSEAGIGVVALIAMKNSQLSNFALVEMLLNFETIDISRITPLQPHPASLLRVSRWQPRICIPEPQETCFVIFEKAIAVISISTATASPEAALLKEPASASSPFQDIINIRDDDSIYPVGYGLEISQDGSRQSSMVVLFKQPGLIRFTVPNPEKKKAVRRTPVGAKSKIEQAISFGSQPTNPLDLSLESNKQFSIEEIEAAVLSISKEVLSSDFPHMDVLTVSLDKELRLRERLLRSLAEQVVPLYPNLSRLCRWDLRSDAEKMVTARRIWSLYQKQLETQASEQRHILPPLISGLKDKFKNTEKPPALVDGLRWFFAKDVSNIGLIFPYIVDVVEWLSKRFDDFNLHTLLIEGCELIQVGLSSAFGFRTEAEVFYGLEGEHAKNGLLETGYEDLREPWTSANAISSKCQDFLSYAIATAERSIEEGDAKEVQGNKVAEATPNVIRAWSIASMERSRWLIAQEDEAKRENGRNLMPIVEKNRFAMLSTLAAVGHQEDSLQLAEEYEDVQALVKCASEYSTFLVNVEDNLKERIADTDEGRAALEKDYWELRALQEKLDRRHKSYIKRFGLRFTEVWYAVYIKDRDYHKLLNQSDVGYRKEVTQFLRAHAGRQKLSWINDVLAEGDYVQAGDTLASAVTSESELWDKKIELACSKLTLLAASEAGSQSEFREHTYYTPARRAVHESAAALVSVQDALYAHVEPALYATTDSIAQLQVVMQDYGREKTAGCPSLQQLLERGLETLVTRQSMDAEMLVDVLTLMDYRRCDVIWRDISGKVFCLALKVLRYARSGSNGLNESGGGLSVAGGEQRWDMILRIVWRRAYIQDDWTRINKTNRKSDEQVRRDLGRTLLFETFYWSLSEGTYRACSASPKTFPPPPLLLSASRSSLDPYCLLSPLSGGPKIIKCT